MELFDSGRAINNGNKQLKGIELNIDNLVYKIQNPDISHPDQMRLKLDSIRDACEEFVKIILQTRVSSLCSYFFNGKKYTPNELISYLGHLCNELEEAITEIQKKYYY